MKTRTRSRVAAMLLTFGISVPAHASPTCLAPEPACALVLLGAVVTTIVHEREDHESAERKATPERVPIKVGADGGSYMHRHPHPTPAHDPASDRWTMRDDRH
ncbi:hypothetical protein [Halofilum ochraceum]|uniref:hypothetical protein n=1 Tax=Halofilum ochraceum TaxID=1611323 RepID=UPI001585D599|nr:hypothetical protein [Halofilum ochraceum]